MPASAVQIEGLAELTRALNQVSREVQKETRDTLKEAAEPVRDSAERLAVSTIRNIGSVWPRMRVGVAGDVVYMVPKTRRSRGGSFSRPNLGRLLMDQAMQPALDKHENEIAGEVDKAMDRLTRRAGLL